MTQSESTAEEREQELAARLKAMEKQMERLTARLGEDAAADTPAPSTAPAGPAVYRDYPPDIGDLSDEVLNWAGRNALLPRLATICFLLVVALVLRTITESGLVNKLIGSGIGMGYAAILIATGWYNYQRNSKLAPVFAACGAILMSIIVVETHSHFKSLPLIPAYLTLVATGIAMALISRQFDAFTPISVGTLAMCLAGAAIDYPNPFFPYLSLVLFAANLLGYIAAQMKRCGWLRWSVLFVSIFMLQLWGVRLGNTLHHGNTPAPDMTYSWFLPVLAAFALTYYLSALCGILYRKSARIARFDMALPTVTSLWAFSFAYYVVSAGADGTRLLGIVGTLVALGLLAISFWLAGRREDGAPGTGTFTVAGMSLLALALPSAIGNLIFSLPVISIAATFMAVASRSWNSGSVRLATYLFQICSSVALAIALRGSDPDSVGAVITILPAALMAFSTLYHYQWCHKWPPSSGSRFFGRFDTQDDSSVFVLIAGLSNLFFMVRSVIYQLLLMTSGTVSPDAFRCSQSVIINVAALSLMALAYLRSDKMLRNVALLITVIGGIKIFAYDLLGAHGLPLVFSVFSFGMAAAVESVALGRWSKKSERYVADVKECNGD